VTTAQNIFALPGVLFGAGGLGVDWQQAVVQIALVDGETGDVLWTTADYFGDFEKNKPSNTVADLFERYPKQKP
jgi:hypothetical protein